MNIIQICGGLGNQLFQYAFAQALSINNNDLVLLDITWFDYCKDRKYELPVYNISLREATQEEIKKTKDKQFIHRLHRSLYKRLVSKNISNVREEKIANVFDAELLAKQKHAYYIGYFQSEKYFANIRDILLNEFTLQVDLTEKNKEILNQIQATQAVSLHIRRGDYLTYDKFFPLCSRDYYTAAVKHIAEKIEKPHFYIFSDDMEWVRKNFHIPYPLTFVDINNANTAYFDLELMRNCKHNIIANSSFSWWGAWLNTNPDKIVIGPEKWFLPEGMPPTDLIPDKWIKINI